MYSAFHFSKASLVYLSLAPVTKKKVSLDLIHNTPFSLQLMNWPNKLECYITLRWKGLTGRNTLAYWAHFKVTKKKKFCENDPRNLSRKPSNCADCGHKDFSSKGLSRRSSLGVSSSFRRSRLSF
jgi:hypothetical protein